MLNKIKRIIVDTYDRIFSTECKASTGDIMHCRGVIENNQFLATTRLLDIEDWYNNEKNFKWQNTVSYAAYGVNHREADGNRAFSNLICSYERNGYNSKSFFMVDCRLVLLDGNHRMGMNLYHGIYEISLKVLKREGKNGYSLDWYVGKKLSSSFLDAVLEEYHKIQEQLVKEGDTFCCIVSDYGMVEALRYLVKVKAVHEYCQNNNKGGQIAAGLSNLRLMNRNIA